jgi:hypothetical protein
MLDTETLNAEQAAVQAICEFAEGVAERVEPSRAMAATLGMLVSAYANAVGALIVDGVLSADGAIAAVRRDFAVIEAGLRQIGAERRGERLQ